MKPRYRRMLRGMEAQENQIPAQAPAAIWSLYILRCRDGSFYTGVTTDIDRRFREHQEGRASRFTRTRRPVVLAYQENCGTRSHALSRECAVKAMGRQGKEDLVKGRAFAAEIDPRAKPEAPAAVAGGSATGRSKRRKR